MFHIILFLPSLASCEILENSTCEEIDSIQKLDKTVCFKLTNPALQDRLSILSELLNLHLLLNEVLGLFRDNNEKAWTIMDNLEDAGGLAVLNARINGTQLQRILKWPDNKMDDIKFSLKGISAIWRDLKRKAKDPLSNANYPKDINFHLEPT